jgi:hypothetical protein
MSSLHNDQTTEREYINQHTSSGSIYTRKMHWFLRPRPKDYHKGERPSWEFIRTLTNPLVGWDH